ncbi:MAG TPA: ABC transporter permease [Chthoniobacteraceae bacterium]|nr:ABC transporter permease [Chthoniobacteraceae bacterium]
MIALIWKEIRGLKTYAYLMLAFAMVGLAYFCWMHFPDAASVSTNPDGNSSSATVDSSTLFCFFIGLWILVGEHENGTLPFLDALPVSRTRVFWAKWIAAMLLLNASLLTGYLVVIALAMYSRSSVDPPVPLAWEFWNWALDVIAIASLLSLAMALSLLRRWFLLVAGLIVAGALWAVSHGWHWVEMVNPLDLSPAMVDGRIQVPVRAALAKAALGIAGAGAAWAGFLLLGTRIQDVRDRMGWLHRVAAAARLIAIPAVWICVLVLLMKVTKSNAVPSGESNAGNVFWQNETQHYEFLMRRKQWSAARPLLVAADKVFDQVSGFFQNARSPDRVLVDLDGSVSWDAAGQTGWTKVRIPLGVGMTLPELKEILGHETAHVLMHRLGGVLFYSASNSTRFFDEGMATVVQEKFFSTPRQIEQMDRWAGASAARGKVPFSLLCDYDKLGQSRDPHLIYPMGRSFCRALIHAYGDAAPARVLAEFQHPRYGARSRGEALWRDVFQQCGYSLERVEAGYDADIADIETREAGFIATLPRLSGTVAASGGDIVIRPHYTGTAPGKIICRVPPPTELSPDAGWRFPETDGSIHVPRGEAGQTEFRYMLGWAVKSAAQPVFEPMVVAPVPAN